MRQLDYLHMTKPYREAIVFNKEKWTKEKAINSARGLLKLMVGGFTEENLKVYESNISFCFDSFDGEKSIAEFGGEQYHHWWIRYVGNVEPYGSNFDVWVCELKVGQA